MTTPGPQIPPKLTIDMIQKKSEEFVGSPMCRSGKAEMVRLTQRRLGRILSKNERDMLEIGFDQGAGFTFGTIFGAQLKAQEKHP